MLVPRPEGDLNVLASRFGKTFGIQNFRLPSGGILDFAMMRAETVPVIGLPVTLNRKVIAIRQFRYAAGEIIVEVPGGLPKDKTPEEVISRELLEETGYRVGTIIRLAEHLFFEPVSLRAQYIPVLMLGCVKEKEPEPDPNEFIEVEEIDLNAWVEMAFRGEIKDDKTLALTFLSLRHLGLL